MKISSAITADIPQLCTLLDYLFTQETEFEVDREAQARGLHKVINGPDAGDILVVRQHDDIIAMVNLLYTVSTALGGRVAIVEDMVVLPTVRGSGIGSKLLTYAIEFAKEKGFKRLTLLTDKNNVDAQRFYQQHGFATSTMIPMRISLTE
jgi:GNAT superfamily N-acetyltransferase